MRPAACTEPEMACICGERAPLPAPPGGRLTCPACRDEMYVIGSAHDFTKQAKGHDDV